MNLTKTEKFLLKISFINAIITFIFILFLAWYDYVLYDKLIASHSVLYDVMIVCVITFVEVLIYSRKLNMENWIEIIEVKRLYIIKKK